MTPVNEVRRHLEKILASSAFSHAPRAQQFLRFIVEETLAGRAGEINEASVAARVFNLGVNFDRRKNSIVRAEATHVRRRLRDYYAGAGRPDSVIVGLPPGRYVPLIRAASRLRFAALLSWFRPGRSAPQA